MLVMVTLDGSLKFHPVDEQWQRIVCAMMGLHFHGVRPGGPTVHLTPPDTLKPCWRR